jgi:hypothetical protein
MIRTVISAAVAAAILAAAPVSAFAQVVPGTTLYGTVTQDINSSSAQPGQPFTVANAHNSDYSVRHATIYGHVSSVQRAGQGTPGSIHLRIDHVRLPSGAAYEVSGYPTSVDVQTKNNALKEVGGAAAGALVGGLLFHGVGALIGAGSGALLAKNNRQNVTIPAGSAIAVRVVAERPQPQ